LDSTPGIDVLGVNAVGQAPGILPHHHGAADTPRGRLFVTDLARFARRFSCRRFAPEPVANEVLAELLEAARWATSAGNLQPWRIVVVRSATVRGQLAAAAFNQTFLAEAPVTVVVCAVPDESGRRYGVRGRTLYCLQDTAAAIENLLLAAAACDLGTCWVGAFDEPAAARALDLDPAWRPVALIPVGRPAEQPRGRRRRPADEVVRVIR
jgi:nitroreductase